MKCINDKCENGLWSKDGCLFPEGTICSGFIPESEKSGVVPVESQSTGSVLNVVVTCAVPTTMREGASLESITEYFRSNPTFLNGYVESVDVSFREAQNDQVELPERRITNEL